VTVMSLYPHCPHFWRVLVLLLGTLPVLNASAAGLPAAPTTAANWQLADAARDGSLNRVQALLDQGIDPNSRDRSGTPALVWAATRSQTETLVQLLNAGADPALGDRNGVTALMWAAWNGDAEAITTLLDAGADPNEQDRYGFTALWVGSYNSAGDSGFAAPLLQAGARPDTPGPDGLTPLMLCAKNGARELGQALIEAGARVGAVDQQRRNALHHALLNGHRALLPALLRSHDKEALDQADRIGLTPLLSAISQSDPALITALLEAGADANGGNNANTGRDHPSPLALSVATSLCRGQAAETLLQHGADPNGADQHGNPALLLAVRQGCHGLVDRLLEAGADIQARDADGVGVIGTAIDSGQLRLTRVLLARGAKPAAGGPSPIISLLAGNQPIGGLLQALLDAGPDAVTAANARDQHGTPALLLATRANNETAVRTLIAAGVQVDATDNSGASALMAAAEMGRLGIAKLLLQAGADPGLRDRMYSESALNKARMAGHTEVEQLLQKAAGARIGKRAPQDKAGNKEAPLTARAN